MRVMNSLLASNCGLCKFVAIYLDDVSLDGSTREDVEILIARSVVYSKVQVHSWTYIRGSRSMSLYVLYACMRTQLASPAEWHLQLSME